MKFRFSHQSLSVCAGLCLTGLMAWLQVTANPVAHKWLDILNDDIYDASLRSSLSKLPAIKNNDIVIIAIDDKSLAAVGQWPWSRKKIAHLVEKLQSMQASVIAFDLVFSEPEENMIDSVMQDLHQDASGGQQSLINSLQTIRGKFAYDTLFADQLKKSDTVLGFILEPNALQATGELPTPLFGFADKNAAKVSILRMNSYTANIPVLQSAAKSAGFIDATPDADGVLRYAPLLYRYQNQVYGSLALEAVRLYLLTEHTTLAMTPYGNKYELEGVKLDNFTIPTDVTGRILIPFRASAFGFPYYAASDVLNGKTPRSAIEGKLVFVGVTAVALGDEHPAAIARAYQGVEVHATIASAIIDHYFPSIPTWSNGLGLILILVAGVLLSFLLPMLGAATLAFIALIVPVIWWLITDWMWIHYSIFLPLFLPVLTIVILAFFNMAGSYLAESKRRKEVKALFGQYVPADYVETIINQHGDVALDGEARQLTVLFTDIRGFTAISESMTASQLKKQLNEYLTPMTETIFKFGGTIDKYVGDMIMAFWNAPLKDDLHAYHAIAAALAMQEKLTTLNQLFIAQHLQPIKIGVGLNSGLMNVGDMGSRFRRAYTALGDGVNLASRLEGLCRYYDANIIVGEETYVITKDSFVFRQIDRVIVKGKTQCIAIYEPVAATEQASAALREELALNQQALDAYFLRDWNGAESIFKVLAESHPEVFVYRLYLQRIAEYKIMPPDADWNGAYISTSK